MFRFEPSKASFCVCTASRALNTHGKWRIIVNEIPASYDKLTQTVRIEKCKYHEAACPKLPGKERGLAY